MRRSFHTFEISIGLMIFFPNTRVHCQQVTSLMNAYSLIIGKKTNGNLSILYLSAFPIFQFYLFTIKFQKHIFNILLSLSLCFCILKLKAYNTNVFIVHMLMKLKNPTRSYRLEYKNIEINRMVKYFF